MRFVEISLEKYGCYAQRSVGIPDGPGLTVIYGPNEAGKSTCLEAIGDFLFGVPGQSSRGAVFGYPSMRIGAVMHLANGETLSLRRRKGNARTLTDEKGVVCDDTLLASTALGPINRDRFETLFGLNHRTLRSGGNDMLAAGGEIGSLIVEAGGGLRAMIKRIEAIDQEAKGLFARTASQDRKFYRARKEFDDADRRAKDHLLSRDAYEQARGRAIEAKKAADAFREERDRLRAVVNVLDRVVRVAPHLVLRNRLLVDHVAFADTADYPEAFSKKVVEAIEARDAAKDALQSALAERDETKGRLDTVFVSDSLADAGNKILDLVEAAIRVSGARESRQKRLHDLDVTNARLHPLRAMLGASPDVDVAGMLPRREAIDRVAALAADAARESAILEAAEARVEELEDEIEKLDGRIAEGQKRGYDRTLGVSAAQFGSLAVQKAALDARRKVAEERKKAVDNAIVWFLVPDTDALSLMSCPAVEDNYCRQRD
jgi:uncharacterized protein YhaN